MFLVVLFNKVKLIEMDLCKCGKDLSLMKKNSHNLRQHLLKCQQADDLASRLNVKPISYFFQKQSKDHYHENCCE